ncbi:MAG: hypothetical protein HY535_00945 [Chloroflexi bacterium]|nr:hypothetical protein [Chloroflexota bacterium]
MVPGLLGLLGAAGAGLALAPALRALTYPFLVLTLLSLGRGWYLQLRVGSVTAWRRRSLAVLAASTLLAATLWGLRFAGLLGGRPF